MTRVTGTFDAVAVGYSCIDYITVVDRLPHLDEKMMAGNLLIQGGGPAATAMVAASRLGARTALITSLADDPIGREIVAGLEEESVDVSLSPVATGGRSAFAFVMIQSGTGLRTIVGSPADSSLSPGDIDTAVIQTAKVLLVDGSEIEAQKAAAAAAREAGVSIVFDAGNEKPGMRELAEFSDVLLASKGFGRDVGGSEHPARAAAALFEAGAPRVVCVTAGPDGAYFATPEGSFHQRAFEVDVVDTTGAGDAFHGGYVYAILRGWDVRRCARFASAVAALKCTKLGGRTGLPTLHEAQELLQNRAGEL